MRGISVSVSVSYDSLCLVLQIMQGLSCDGASAESCIAADKGNAGGTISYPMYFLILCIQFAMGHQKS